MPEAPSTILFQLQVLLFGLDDWIQMIQVESVCSYYSPVGSEEARSLALATIDELFKKDLLRVGDIKDGEFCSWGSDRTEVMARLHKTRSQFGEELKLWEVCWMELTPKGYKKAEALEQFLD